MHADSSPRERAAPPRHHAVIAGTGRAGTSFLVRFLGGCGLDVGDPDGVFDDRARAGLEHHLTNEQLPYVVKDPWLFAYCDAIDPEVVVIDALIVPIRELMAAATSRLLQERVAMAETVFAKWPASDVNGIVIGGAVYSLDPVDEARILAVGFHRLIHWATTREIPLYLLQFPRSVTDRDYLVGTLWPWLSGYCDRDRAESAFTSIAAPDLVRVQDGQAAGPPRPGNYDAGDLDREAMTILVKERESQLADMEGQLARVTPALANTERELAGARAEAASTEVRLGETRVVLGNVQSQLQMTHDQLAERNRELGEVRARLSAESAEREAMRHSSSWRVTAPMRRVRRLLRRRPPAA